MSLPGGVKWSEFFEWFWREFDSAAIFYLAITLLPVLCMFLLRRRRWGRVFFGAVWIALCVPVFLFNESHLSTTGQRIGAVVVMIVALAIGHVISREIPQDHP